MKNFKKFWDSPLCEVLACCIILLFVLWLSLCLGFCNDFGRVEAVFALIGFLSIECSAFSLVQEMFKSLRKYKETMIDERKQGKE